jgi:hypothetical protein
MEAVLVLLLGIFLELVLVVFVLASILDRMKK